MMKCKGSKYTFKTSCDHSMLLSVSLSSQRCDALGAVAWCCYWKVFLQSTYHIMLPLVKIRVCNTVYTEWKSLSHLQSWKILNGTIVGQEPFLSSIMFELNKEKDETKINTSCFYPLTPCSWDYRHVSPCPIRKKEFLSGHKRFKKKKERQKTKTLATCSITWQAPTRVYPRYCLWNNDSTLQKNTIKSTMCHWQCPGCNLKLIYIQRNMWPTL
jgi:hypothetical protein